MPAIRMRVAAVALGFGLLSILLTSCGAGVRPTPTGGASVGTAVPAAGSQPSGAVAPAASSAATARKQYSAAPPTTIDQNKTYIATIKTNQGDIKVQLDPKNAPITVNNFVFLARDGYYNNVPFHRVMKNFMVQSGDPTGTGTGSPGYTIPDELVKGNYQEGSIAMANTGQPNSGGAQFFICEGNGCQSLPKTYSLFGQVTDGLDVLHKIADVPVTNSASGEKSKPTQQLTINTVEISEQ